MKRASRRNFRAKDIVDVEANLHTTAEVDLTLTREWRRGEYGCATIRLRVPTCYARDLAKQIIQALKKREQIAISDIESIAKEAR